MKLTLNVFLLLLLMSSYAVFAEPMLPSELQVAGMEALQEQNNLLRAQLEAVESYQDRLLATVYWALGTLATIATLLVGFGWFANFRIYERDKDALANLIESSLTQESKALERLVNEKEEHMHSALKGLVNEKLDAAVEPISYRVRNLEIDLKRDFAMISAEVLEIERQRWIKEEVFTNALRVSRKLLENASLTQSDWRVGRVLDMIQEDLRSIMRKGRSTLVPDAEDVGRLIAVLEGVNHEHAVVVDSIKSLIVRVRELDYE